MSRTIIDEKTKSLDRVRQERAALAASLADLAGAVQRAVEAEKTAEVDAVIAPGAEAQSRVEAARRMREAIVAKRDGAERDLERREQAEKRLVAEIRDLDQVVRRGERATAALELEKRLEAGRARARDFIVEAGASLMLQGVTVSDIGMAAIQALDPKQNVPAIVSGLYAKASALRERIDRGEVL